VHRNYTIDRAVLLAGVISMNISCTEIHETDTGVIVGVPIEIFTETPESCDDTPEI